jgi:hypothetical protein
MKFMLMMIDDEKHVASLSDGDIDKILEKHTAFADELRARGKWIGANRLRVSSEASTLRLRDGKPVVIDGPFAESKEAVGGYHLIEAASKQEAIELAKKLPLLARGAIEVRPVFEMT